MRKILLLVSIGLLSACGQTTEKIANPFEDQILVSLENANNQFHFQHNLLRIYLSTMALKPTVAVEELSSNNEIEETITNIHVKKQGDTYVVTGEPHYSLTLTQVGERLYTTDDGEEYKTIVPR